MASKASTSDDEEILKLLAGGQPSGPSRWSQWRAERQKRKAMQQLTTLKQQMERGQVPTLKMDAQ